VRSRAQLGLLVVCGAVALAVALGSVAATAAAKVTCPTSSDTGGTVQWAFSVIGPPTPPTPAGYKSWTRGEGNWTRGTATGAVCVSDSGGGLPARSLVLAPAGGSTITPHITELGLLGVGLVLPVRVASSNDTACPKGSIGDVKLFASYYGTHKDRITTHFAGGCAGHNHTFTGSGVRVLIAHDGAQVNTSSGT
jgi:hypothetical protein